MPRLTCTFRRFIEIIEAHGFVLHRTGATSHKRWRGVVNGRVMMVDVACHNMGDHIAPKTLASMIRQSGLGKDAFKH